MQGENDAIGPPIADRVGGELAGPGDSAVGGLHYELCGTTRLRDNRKRRVVHRRRGSPRSAGQR